MLVLVLVLFAAAAGGLGLVLLRRATDSQPASGTFSVGLLLRLIRRSPTWSLGILSLLSGFGLQVVALANGPVSLVQLVVVLELPFSLVFARLLLGGRLHNRETTGIAAMTVGVIILLLTLAPHGGDPAATSLTAWLFGLAATAAVIALTLRGGRGASPSRRAALFGIAAGAGSGLIAVLVKPVAHALPGGVGAVLTTWQTWALVVAGVLGFFLIQNAVQTGRLVASQPGITLANPLIAAVWGIGVFGEEIRTGPWLLGAALGLALLAAGATQVSRSPLLEEQPERAVPVPS